MRRLFPPIVRWLLAWGLAVSGALATPRSDGGQKERVYDLAAGEASEVLRAFARTAQVQLLFPERAAMGVRLPALRGTFSVEEALQRLLADSPLEAVRDRKTGAFAVRRAAAPSVAARPDPKPAPKPPPHDREKPPPPTEMDPVRIEQRRDFGVTTQSILRADPLAPLYHHVATREEIEQTGVTNMAEFVTTLPGYSGEGAEALQATADFTFLGGANVYAGSFLKLRGWDAQHTTVLLNGRPLPASPESRGPDLSRIPLAAVERIEVMPFAGSAIYGDGAVGGAMNIVLRKDFSGRSFSAQVGDSTRGGGGEFFLTWIEGLAVNGRTKATIIGDYQQRSALRLGERHFLPRAVSRLPAETALANLAAGTRTGSALAAELTGYPAVFTAVGGATDLGIPGRPGARFAVVPTGWNAALVDRSEFTETTPGAVLARRQDRVVLRRPGETFNINVQLEHAVAPERFELYGELGYARADERFSAPDAVNPLLMSATDPRNPFRNDPARGIFDRSVLFYFDPVDLPDAAFRQMRDSMRAVLGARGAVPGHWHWMLDGFFDVSRSRASVRSYGASLNDLTRAWTPATAELLTQFYDPLSDHRASPLPLEKRERNLARNSWLDHRSKLAGADFRVGGPAVALPAGPLRVALGAEYAWRDVSTRQQVEASREFYAVIDSLNAGAASNFNLAGVSATRGYDALTAPRRTADSGHRVGAALEAIVPLLRSRAGETFRHAELNLASRAAQTDRGHPARSSLAALKFAPSASWALRATFSQGHVTPESSLINSPVVESVTTVGVRDPRRGGPQVYSLKTIRGGSPSLRAETSQARVLGLLFTPRAAPGFFASVDAWSISMKDRLRVPTIQEMVDHADFFPDKVQRGVPMPWESLLGWAGPVTSVDLRPVHVTRLRARGIDASARYRLPATWAGRFTLSGQLEVVERYDEQFLPNTPVVDKIDVVADANGGLMESAVVSPRARAALTWQRGAWFATVGMSYSPRYRTETTEPTTALPSGSGVDGEFVGSSTRWDLQLGYTFGGQRTRGAGQWLADTKWLLGVRNIFDREPPFRSDGSSFYSRFDDPRMRFVYLRVQWQR